MLKFSLAAAAVLLALTALAVAQDDCTTCIGDPTDPSCASCDYALGNATADIENLCQVMPGMSMCSLKIICESGSGGVRFFFFFFFFFFVRWRWRHHRQPSVGVCWVVETLPLVSATGVTLVGVACPAVSSWFGGGGSAGCFFFFFFDSVWDIFAVKLEACGKAVC